jgi:hypothetical protein
VFFLNLSAAEFLALLTASSGLLVGLYLLDRVRRRQTVATLRFWTTSEQPAETKHRRRVRDPWSLLLQILGVALLLAALSQLRIGSQDRASLDHVLILDTSAWMAARGPQSTLLAEAKSLALAWLRALPSTDRVMVIRADGLATPATVFDGNRRALSEVIRSSAPGASALQLERALEFAKQVQRSHARRAGEIVFVGSMRITSTDGLENLPPNLRVIPVGADPDNVGLRKMTLKRPGTDVSVWQVFVSVRNYGNTPRTAPLMLAFGGAPVGSRRLELAPGAEQSTTFEFRTRAAGWLEARLAVRDAYPEDDRAVVEVPSGEPVRVAVFSNEPDLLRPLMTANRRINAVFERTSDYRPKTEAQLMILDRFVPPSAPSVPALWLDPPTNPYFRGRDRLNAASITTWHSHPVSSGLRTRDIRVEGATVFEPVEGMAVVAGAEAGPVILARDSQPRAVVFGFHPIHAGTRYDLATPLLFANALRWMLPELFGSWEVNAESAGMIETAMGSGDVKDLRVVDERGRSVPFAVHDSTLRFFAGTTGNIRVQSDGKERVFSLTLPEMGHAKWQVPAAVKRGLPRRFERGASSQDLWEWLAIAGAVMLLVEWLIYGRTRRLAPAPGMLGDADSAVPIRKAS